MQTLHWHRFIWRSSSDLLSKLSFCEYPRVPWGFSNVGGKGNKLSLELSFGSLVNMITSNPEHFSFANIKMYKNITGYKSKMPLILFVRVCIFPLVYKWCKLLNVHDCRAPPNMRVGCCITNLFYLSWTLSDGSCVKLHKVAWVRQEVWAKLSFLIKRHVLILCRSYIR